MLIYREHAEIYEMQHRNHINTDNKTFSYVPQTKVLRRHFSDCLLIQLVCYQRGSVFGYHIFALEERMERVPQSIEL